GCNNQQAIDDQAKIGEALQQLREESNQRCADQRSGNRTSTAENHYGEEENGGVELESLRTNEALQKSKQVPACASQCRTDREGNRPDRGSIESDGWRSDRILAHSDKGASPRRTHQFAQKQNDHSSRADYQKKLSLQTEPHPRNCRARYVQYALGPAGQFGPLNGDAVDNYAESDGDH